MTAARLVPVSPTAFDARVACLQAARLTRAASATYLETDRGIEETIYELALSGIRVVPCGPPPSPGTGLRPAIAFDLVPLDAALEAIDVVELRQIPLSIASLALTRRRIPWLRGSQMALDGCRRLLRGEDAVVGWRRVVWCPVAALRKARARVRLRPVVFDRAAIERNPLRWAYVGAGDVERWAFA